MENLLKKYLNIRYVKLHFYLTFPEDSILPIYKASALRGGIGEMLLRANCIRNRDCKNCDFESECMVQRTMYSKFENKPAFITSGDSAGYVIECEDYHEEYEAGSTMQFNLILFGKTIVYFNSYLQAIAALGQNGIGKYKTRFWISRITNTIGEDILSGSDINMAFYKVQTIDDYVEYRKAMLMKNGMRNRVEVKTPLTIKYQGDFIKEFDMHAIVRAVQRRILILDCFENIEGDELYRKEYQIPDIIKQRIVPRSVRRFSNRQEQGMWLHGIEGILHTSEIQEELLELLLAGEILHIGKNTSFGFGRYRLV